MFTMEPKKEPEKFVPATVNENLRDEHEITENGFTYTLDEGYNPAYRAYKALLECRDNPSSMLVDFEAAVDEAIGYLGECLA